MTAKQAILTLPWRQTRSMDVDQVLDCLEVDGYTFSRSTVIAALRQLRETGELDQQGWGKPYRLPD
jgi:Fe2+ or Zn2+ uptake regulation protein